MSMVRTIEECIFEFKDIQIAVKEERKDTDIIIRRGDGSINSQERYDPCY